MSQYLLEEAYATALELHEAGLIADREEDAARQAAVDKSQQRRERQRAGGR